MIPNAAFWRRKHIYLLISKELNEEWHLTFIRIWNSNRVMVQGVLFDINGFIFNFKHLLTSRFKRFIFQPFINSTHIGSVFLIVACNLVEINTLLSFLFIFVFCRSGYTYRQLPKNRTGWMLLNKMWIGIMKTC